MHKMSQRGHRTPLKLAKRKSEYDVSMKQVEYLRKCFSNRF